MTDNPKSGDSWYEKTELIRIREYNLATKIHLNSGKPWLVLLHGFPTCSYDWYKMWPSLIQEYQVLAFDFLGYGRSDKPYPHRYSIIEQAELTLALLSHLEITSCFIIAHNYAVSVTQEILSRIQENRCNLFVKKIIFLNGGLFSEMHRPRPIQKLLLSPFGKIANLLFNKNSFQRNMNQIFGPETQLSDQEINELWALINYNKGKRVFPLLIKYMLDRKENRDRWVKNMQKTNIPMKLVNGPLDPVSGRHLVEHYSTIIPNPDTVILEGVGHYPNIEAPKEVVDHAYAYFQ